MLVLALFVLQLVSWSSVEGFGCVDESGVPVDWQVETLLNFLIFFLIVFVACSEHQLPNESRYFGFHMKPEWQICGDPAGSNHKPTFFKSLN
jgi:hypothetical protein